MNKRLISVCSAAVVIFSLALAACGPAATATGAPAATEAPIAHSSPTPPPTLPAITPDTQLDLQHELARIDSILSESVKSSIAYNAPQTMVLQQPTVIELLMNPAISPTALGTQVTSPGSILTATIDVTPLMKAVLIAADPAAFTVQPEHDDAIQAISGTSTTRWAWSVIPKKSGSQQLTLVIYRLLRYQGQDYWRNVETYRAKIDVQVTLAQRLADLDWKWILGPIITLIGVPALWRWVDRRRQKSGRKSHASGKR